MLIHCIFILYLNYRSHRYDFKVAVSNGERFGTPDTKLAAIITRVLVDTGIVTRTDLSQVIDRSMIRRIR